MSDPLIRHSLVRMVDRANRIQANPYHRLGLRLEESIIYRDNVRHYLERLSPKVRNAVLLMVEGHSAAQAAEWSGISTRAMQRSLDEMWVN
jgi:DNA-directed RNA polymerase specialized sigma24 family protein